MAISFKDQVVIITGAGNGLGKSHALEFAKRGAKVVVNDFGGDRHGQGGSSEAAEAVVKEINDAGGEAIANGADVSNREQVDAMVAQAQHRIEHVRRFQDRLTMSLQQDGRDQTGVA